MSIDDDGHVQFTNMQLQNEGDVKIMFSGFGHYHTKRQTKWHITLVKFGRVISSNLILPKTNNEILTCMVEPDKEVTSLSDLWSILSLIDVFYLCWCIADVFYKLLDSI